MKIKKKKSEFDLDALRLKSAREHHPDYVEEKDISFLDKIGFNSYDKLLSKIKNLPEEERDPHFRNLCRKDLYFLIRYGMDRPDIGRKWLFDRCREVQKNPDGHIDLWSREHYKSTVITVGKTIQDIICSHGEGAEIKKELTFCIFSHTRPIAKGFLRQIKREAENNPRFRQWFPDVFWDNPSSQAPSWSEDNGLIFKRKSNPKESTVEAWGLVDGQPTSKHFDILIYDDIVTSKSVYTPEMIAKTTRELELSFNLGAHGGTKRMIGTRYHFGDTYKTVIDRKTAIPRVYPATKDGSVNGEPVLIDKESLMKKRRDMGNYTFNCQMLQNPVADSDKRFMEHWLSYHDPDTYKGGGNNYILVDPANTKKKTSDYTVMLVVQARSDRKLYIMDGIRDKLNLTEKAVALVRLCKKWNPMIEDGIRYERYGAQADVDYIYEYMKKVGYRRDIKEVGGNIAKTERILKLVPFFENGELMLPYNMIRRDFEGNNVDIVSTFIQNEYLAFPQCSHDDMLDCMARAVDQSLPLIYPNDDLYEQKHMGTNKSLLEDMDMEDFLL